MIIEGFNIPANKFAFQNLYLLKQDDADETSSQKPQVTQDSIYRVSEVMPEYPGGPNEMMSLQYLLFISSIIKKKAAKSSLL